VRVTLIRPRTGNSPDPPLGLMMLSACAKIQGHNIQILDPNPSDEHIEEQIREFHPDLIAYSLLTTQISRAQEIQRNIKKHFPNVLTAAGGIHPTALPEWTLKNLDLDFVVCGEGEITFVEVLNTLDKNGDFSTVPGVATLKNNNLLKADQRPLIEDLDTLPLPDRTAVPFHRYLRPPGNIRGKFLKRGTSMFLSRGCPFGCIFCSSHDVFGRRVRRRSISHIMSEIELLISNYKVDGLWFLDDTLLEDQEWLKDLCGAMKKTGLPWGCQAHVRRADENLFRIMKNSGCLQLEFGVESGSDRILRRLRKGSDTDDIRRAFSICKRLSIRTLANFMIGIPDETMDDAELSFQLAKEIDPDHVVVTFTTPLPGSDLYREACEKKWIPNPPDFSDRWIIRQTEDPAVACSMDADTMKAIRKKFDNHFLWSNTKNYFLHPLFLFLILADIFRNPRKYGSGFKRALRTGRLLHIVETIWEGYNRI